MSFLDSLLGGVKKLYQGGTAVALPPNTSPSALNFASGATATYNATTGAVDVVVTATAAAGQNPATLSNGLNSNIATGGQPTVRLAGPSGAFSVGGFQLPGAATPQAGQQIQFASTVAQQITVVHEDTSSAAVARFSN